MDDVELNELLVSIEANLDGLGNRTAKDCYGHLTPRELFYSLNLECAEQLGTAINCCPECGYGCAEVVVHIEVKGSDVIWKNFECFPENSSYHYDLEFCFSREEYDIQMAILKKWGEEQL